MKTVLHSLFALGILFGSLCAQGANYTVGPSVVPRACSVSITLSNDNPFALGVIAPLFRVTDAQGQLVFQPYGPPFAITMLNHGWFTFYWDLTDLAGVRVPPGNYTLEVQYDTFVEPTAFPITVVPDGAGLVFEGTATTTKP